MNQGRRDRAQRLNPIPLDPQTAYPPSKPARSAVDISVVFPMYNEEDYVQKLIEEIHAAMGPTGRSYEIIAVDDHSSDDTLKRLKESRSDNFDLHVLSLRKNVGQTGALMAGLRQARGDTIVTLDGDGQNDPADIPSLLQVFEEDETVDVVSGWRHKRLDQWLLRKFPSHIANMMVRAVTGTRVHDLGCSLKAYRREVVEDLHLYGEMHRFVIPLVEQKGARVAELKVNHRPRTTGKSNYGLGRTYKVIIDLLTVWFLGGFQQKPSYLFGGVGLILWGLSGACFAATLWQKLFYAWWVHKNPLFICGIFFGLGGLQLFATGLISELIIRTYYESTNTPTYEIEDKASR